MVSGLNLADTAYKINHAKKRKRKTESLRVTSCARDAS
jgi:hypothetical protein